MPDTIQLDEVLRKAMAEPEFRNDFYQQLMNSEVYVVGHVEEPEAEGESGHIKLKHWQQPDGSYAMPFFATMESLKASLGQDEPHLMMPVVELFHRTKGVTLILTAEGISKAFKPDEVEVLLSSVMALDPLAKALLKAIKEKNETSQREFYQTLVNSTIFVIGQPEDYAEPTNEMRQMAENDQFIFMSCEHPFKKGEKVLPFFSSLDYLKRILPKDGTYMSFHVMTFFSMVRFKGMPLVLNLGSDPHKFFSLEEINFLLSSIQQENFETRKFKAGTKIILGPPDIYPQEMVGALLDFLPKFPVVKAAYLTMMREDIEDAKPVMVLGFEADGDLIPMYRETGSFIEQYGEEGMPIDFAEVKSGEEGLSAYFLEKVSPFYLRPLLQHGANQPVQEEGIVASSEQLDKPSLLGRLRKVFGGEKKSGGTSKN